MDNQNNVWIDRHEYERLKALENQTPHVATVSSPVAGSMPDSFATDSSSSVGVLTILTAVFALFSFLFPPAILVFLGLGITSIVKFFRGRSSHGTKTAVGATLVVLVVISLIVAGPFLLLFAFILMWQIGCWTGLGSCTTA